MALHHHHLAFVLPALVVAILGSWTALDLFRRVRSHIGRAQGVWLAAAAMAMGASIWSMHFIAMLGFDPGSPVRYDLPLTFVSLALAVGATSGAFFAAARPRPSRLRLLVAGAAMGTGICLMHYVGMAALRGAVSFGYRPAFVAASFLIAVGASSAALFVARRDHALAWRALAAVTLGLAVVGMHYTAMAGLRVTPTQAGAAAPGAPPIVLGVSIAAVTLVILLLALLASFYDQRLNVLAALEAGDVGYWEFQVNDRVLQLSPGAKRILGQDPEGEFGVEQWLEALTPTERGRWLGFVAGLQPSAGSDNEYHVVGRDGVERFVNVRGRVVAQVAGRPLRMVGIILDVSDRRRAFTRLAEAERRQRLLIDELNHRVKNTLATVQSVARQTARNAGSLDSFGRDFENRLMALSQTHNALTRGGWESAGLEELLRQELTPYVGGQVRWRGAPVDLPARAALSVGMVIHELATNAAKYGALSTAEGRLAIEWALEADGHTLVLRWLESGGPAVAPPQRQGFGSRLVRAAIEGELGGSAELAYLPDGLRARLAIPLPEQARGPFGVPELAAERAALTT